jgi:glycosyltransferase involved in cell wall biosynthesis
MSCKKATRSRNDSLVSIIIPVYNCEQYLTEAIESALSQTYPFTEIIVIDDGSTDGTADAARQFAPQVRYCYQPNAGTGAARNKGIDLADGDYFSFLDADDLWSEDKLRIQMAAFRGNPGVDIVFGYVKQFHSPELDETEKSRIVCPEELMRGSHPCTMLIKRESFFRVGLFETDWKVGEGVSWMIRAKEQGLRTLTVPELMYMRRLHKTNKGITHRHFMKDRVRILKASLDRRRNSAVPETESDQ